MKEAVDALVSTPADAFGAFVSLCPPQRASAGPLSGLTLAVKDNISVAGAPFTAGLALFADRIAAQDADIVLRLGAAGARVVGVTRTDAGGFGVTTPDVKNPVLPGHVVGGSSGGSAAAVAAGLADIGIGTDTGGSVRIPAACCGLVGFKPTHDRLSLDGVWPLAPEFDTLGIIARDVASLERAAATLLSPVDPTEPTQSLRLGLDRERLTSCDPVVVAVIERALRQLADAGVEIVTVSLPDRLATMHVHGMIVLDRARALYAQAWRTSANLFLDTARRALAAAEKLTSDDVLAARETMTTVKLQFRAACEGVDAIITPTLPVAPPRCDVHRIALAGSDVPIVLAMLAETCLANVTGVPALSMPCPNPQGVFVSLQLLAPHHHDLRVIAIARRIETLLAI